MPVLVTYDRRSADGSLAATPLRKVMGVHEAAAYVLANGASDGFVRITIEPLTSISDDAREAA